MRLEIAAVSGRGTVRSVNEDNLIVDGELLPELHPETVRIEKRCCARGPVLLGVFDGMGGYASGETASHLSALAAQTVFSGKEFRKEPEKLLRRICDEANRAVCGEMLRRGSSHMGSTAALLLAKGREYYLCNVGDSPILLLRSGELRQLSREHTERATYEVVTGVKSDPKKKFRLTQHIGMPVEDVILEPHCDRGTMQAQDVFLLCSDGVTDMLSHETIAQRLCLPNAREAAESIVEQALEAGGRDNITVIVVRCKGGVFSRFGKSEKRKGDLGCGK